MFFELFQACKKIKSMILSFLNLAKNWVHVFPAFEACKRMKSCFFELLSSLQKIKFMFFEFFSACKKLNPCFLIPMYVFFKMFQKEIVFQCNHCHSILSSRFETTNRNENFSKFYETRITSRHQRPSLHISVKSSIKNHNPLKQ